MKKVSEATKRNFEKLNKDLENHQFVSRANKRDSNKHICPVELFVNKKNQDVIETIIDDISEVDYPLDRIVDSLIVSYFDSKKIYNKNIDSFISTLNPITNFPALYWPSDERDPVGIIYQHLLTEGEKNKKGSYYTPDKIIASLVNGEKIGDKTVCDPCCGSGSFLIHLLENKLVNPDKVYGYDIDKNAVNITIMNLLILNPHVDYIKHIFHKDFLLENNVKYDYFITNPPWGSFDENATYSSSIVKSGESYSYFIEKCLRSLKDGKLIFLLPVSFLNVKTHLDIRTFVLEGYYLNTVFVFGKCFKGVLTDVIGVKIEQKTNKDYYLVVKDNETSKVQLNGIVKDNNYVIPTCSEIDLEIIEKINKLAKYNLENADFALGIVTGNNKELLFETEAVGLRPILTGKDIHPIYAEHAKNYIHYDRKKFQQVCDDRYFAAKSKLIYKFISKRLCFAVDKESTLTLNSANILLSPENFYVSDEVLAALLSSAVINFYFITQVNQIKILKEDIKRMPLPELSESTIKELQKVCDYSLKNKEDKINEVNNILYNEYGFNDNEIQRIEEIVYGKVNGISK